MKCLIDKWYEIKFFRFVAHFFGVRFYRKCDVEKVKDDAEKMYTYFKESGKEGK